MEQFKYYYYYKMYWLEWQKTVAGALNNEKKKKKSCLSLDINFVSLSIQTGFTKCRRVNVCQSLWGVIMCSYMWDVCCRISFNDDLLFTTQRHLWVSF